MSQRQKSGRFSPFSNLLLAAAIFSAAPGAFAKDYAAGQLKIENPWLRPAGEREANLFLSVSNEGSTQDKLVSVRTPRFAKAVIHADPARLVVPHSLVIPSRATVLMEPGRPYVSLQEAKEPLAVGEGVEVELIFEKAGKVMVEASVEAPDARKANDAEAMKRWKTAHDAPSTQAAH